MILNLMESNLSFEPSRSDFLLTSKSGVTLAHISLARFRPIGYPAGILNQGDGCAICSLCTLPEGESFVDLQISSQICGIRR